MGPFGRTIEELHQLKYEHRDDVLTKQQMLDLDENYLLEMSIIRPRESGLPYELWLDPAGEDRGNEHTDTPRLKVKVDGTYIPVLISETPDIPESTKKNGHKDFPHLSAVKKYIVAYRKALLAHYFKDIKDEDIHKYIGTIKQAPQLELKLEHDLYTTEPGRIEYFWDSDEMLYTIQVISEDGAVVSTTYAFDDNLLNKEIYELKNVYEVSSVVNLDKT